MRLSSLRGATALMVGAALLLAGCGSSDDDTSSKASPGATGTNTAATPTAADLKAIRSIEVTGKEGTEPKVTFDAPLTFSAATTDIASDGSGDKISEGAVLSIQLSQYDAASGKKLHYEENTVGKAWTTKPQAVGLSEDNLGPDLTKDLVGKKVGARFLIGTPPASDGAEAGATATSEPTSKIIVGEVVGLVPSKAEGTAVSPAAGLPTVTRADDGTPTITIPKDYKAPDDLVVQTLIKGDGDAVTAGQTLLVQYTGELLDGTVFDSSWKAGQPFTVQSIGGGNVIKGWDQGLVGQTVGSQVLLVIPPSLGYGDQEQGSIPANSTLVFVVDILAAY